jgi:hypothetical protein
MPGRRRGRPGLLGTMGRTAAIVGTAQVTVNALDARRQGRVSTPPAPAPASAPQQQPVSLPAPGPASTPATSDDVDLVGALSRLAQLRDSGALTESEFQVAKSRILA